MARIRHTLSFLCWALNLNLLLFTSSSALSRSDSVAEGNSPLTQPGPAEAGGVRIQPLRVSVDLVLVPVTVTDVMNRPQTDLTREDFALYESEQAQQIRYFSKEDSPISVGLLLDISKSMEGKIDTERTAVDEFFKNANPEDDYFAITFNNKPRVLSDTARTTAGIQSELGLVEPSGYTALLDAVYLGVAKLRNARYPRRALVIISDGGDNSSRYKLREIKNLVAESDVMVYAIGIFDSGPFKSFEEAMGKRWLSAITDITGGRTITVDNLAKLPEASADLSRELRSQYVLGYEPRDKALDGKWRKIKVVVARPTEAERLRSYHRQGYYPSTP